MVNSRHSDEKHPVPPEVYKVLPNALDEKHPVPREVYVQGVPPDFRKIVVTHKSKWNVWYQDWYSERVVFNRITSRVMFELEVERGDIIRVHPTEFKEENILGTETAE